MLMPLFLVRKLFVGAIIIVAGVASAQNYPIKPVRIVTSVAGGGNDLLARVTAQKLTVSLGQQVIVDNRGVVAADIVAKSPPDGYNLILYGSPLWLAPFLREVAYDPVRDFAPITLLANTPGIIVVHPSLPVKSIKELIALARARPGELNYAAGAMGASPHLSGELFKLMTGINIVHVPYKGAGPAVNALLGGHVHLMFATANTVLPHMKAGRLRALAVSSAQPSALAPELPTVAASGVPGYEAEGQIGILAPAKTPASIVNRLNEEIVRALHTADVAEHFFNTGNEVVGSPPEQFAALIKSDMAKWGRLIKDVGIREE